MTKNAARDADLVVMVDCQIPADYLTLYFLWLWDADSPACQALRVAPKMMVMPFRPLGRFFADNMAGLGQ